MVRGTIEELIATRSLAEALSHIISLELSDTFGSIGGRKLLDLLHFQDKNGDGDSALGFHQNAPEQRITLSRTEVIELVGSKAIRPLDAFIEKLIDEATQQSVKRLPEQAKFRPVNEVLPLFEGSIPHPEHANCLRTLETSPGLIIEGTSSSGKSTLLSQLAMTYLQDGSNVVWVDLSDTTDAALSLMSGLEAGKKTYVFVDDAQASPAQVERLFQLNRLFMEPSGFDIKTIFSTWPTGSKYISDRFNNHVVRLNPSKLVRRIVSEYAPDADEHFLDRVWRVSNGDCYIARLLSESDRDLTTDTLQSAIFSRVFRKQRTSKRDRATAYVLASLGQFDIPVTRAFLKMHVHDDVQNSLDSLALRRAGDRVSLGHRTFCFLTSVALQRQDPDLRKSYGSASDLAFQYVQGLDDTQLFNFLSRLDLSARPQNGGSQADSNFDQKGFLLRLWHVFEVLRGRLVRLAAQDPSFGDNIASAVFAGTVLGNFSEETWEQISNYVRHRWDVDKSGKVIARGEPSEERDDFDAIVDAISRGDEFDRFFDFWERAQDIDRDRFHQSWLLGLLLLFEGKAPYLDVDRQKTLKACALSRSMPSGAFYPQRVVWVTARVLSGLAAVGERVGSDEAIRSAYNWLRQPAPNGPLIQDCYWAHGTGSWNTPHQATAMCLSALLDLGVPPSDAVVANARTYLLQHRDEWSSAGNEITRIDVVDALIRAGSDWRAFRGEIESIIAWSLDPNSWSSGGSVKATEEKIESSTLPYITSQVLQLLWTVMKENTAEILREANKRFFESELAALLSPSVSDQEKADRAEDLRRRMATWGPNIQSLLKEKVDSRVSALARMHDAGTQGLTKTQENLKASQHSIRRFEELLVLLDSRRISDDKILEIYGEFSVIADEVMGDAWKF